MVKEKLKSFGEWIDCKVGRWVKIFAIVAATLGISETCGLAGPCVSPDWAFQTKAEAKTIQSTNAKTHEKQNRNTAVIGGKLDLIFQAFPKTWQERGHKHKKGRK